MKIGILLLISSLSLLASIHAITDTGDEVILKNDGTWSYTKNIQDKSVLSTNSQRFTKPQDASFLLKSTKNSCALWLNPTTWSFKKPEEASDAEYELQLKNGDLYGMVINEEIEVNLKALTDIAISNAQEVSTNLHIDTKEYRIVNGHKVIFMQMSGTIQGIDFTYLGYYYSDSSGSTQLLVYTASNLVAKYRTEIFNLLNGFVTQ